MYSSGFPLANLWHIRGGSPLFPLLGLQPWYCLQGFPDPWTSIFGLPFPGQSCCTAYPERRKRESSSSFLGGTLSFSFPFHHFLLFYNLTELSTFPASQEAPFSNASWSPSSYPHGASPGRLCSLLEASTVLDINSLIIYCLRTMVL